MKRALFIFPSFQRGGTTSNILTLLDRVDPGEARIDIFAMYKDDATRERYRRYRILPQTLLLTGFRGHRDPLKRAAAASVDAAAKLAGAAGLDLRGRILRGVARRLSRGGYDLVVACQEGPATRLASMVDAKRRVAWVRCNYDYCAGVNATTQSHYARFDAVVCVSRYTRDIFARHFPALDAKIHAVHNPQDAERIKELAAQSGPEPDSFSRYKGFKMISIGRVDPVKRYNGIAPLARTLADAGHDFRWYIIGDGPAADSAALDQSIAQSGAQGLVARLGAQSNPYRFLAQCDLLVVLSESEACPTVINEAKILGVPVVTTDYGSAPEMLPPAMGPIVPYPALADTLRALLADPARHAALKANVATFAYDNAPLYARLSELLGLDLTTPPGAGRP